MTWQSALWLLLTVPTLAQAAGPLVTDSDGKDIDFALRFARAKMPLDYGGRSYNTTSRWIGVSILGSVTAPPMAHSSWREKTGERLTLGMYGGYAYVTQSNNPVTAGIELDGYHAGVSLHGDIPASRRASLFYAFAYTYQKADHKNDRQTVVIDWSEAQAQLGAIVALTKKLRLYGGGNYGYIDGEERASGAINSTTDIRRDARAGGFLGIDLNVELDGYVGIEAGSGLTRRAEIYFKRRF